MDPKRILDSLSKTNSAQIGTAVEELVMDALVKRRKHERRWFDNNYFDDGYHFRMISRRTGRVVDTIQRNNQIAERAIPRASRQIRGVSNLLFAAEPYPVIYPQRITVEDFRMPDGKIDVEAYQAAWEKSKQIARKQGVWVSTEWENHDLDIQLINMLLKAAKTSVAYLQIWSDTEKQEIKTAVFDGFDIILYGNYENIQDVPFVTKATPMLLREVQNSPLFDPAMVKKLTPDNKYATSEIKDAYMKARFGNTSETQDQATIMIKESFIKEYLSEENWKQAQKLDAGGAMEGKSPGDMIMRHVFSAAGITLRDEYIDCDCYPFAEFRYEPGPLYQVPLIERFIPQNKSLDLVVSRVEQWVNTMVTGIYMSRKGENFQISNFPGGQKVEYEVAPPQQMAIGNVGPTPFNLISLLDKYIDEQGAPSAALNQLPQGVKSGVAIESIKATEYANLKISTKMLKKCIKDITLIMLERADKDIIEPQEVEYMEDDEPDYFDVIGSRGMKLSEQVGKALPQDVVPLSKDVKVRIEIEPGLGLTMQGKKEAMQQIIDYMIKLMQVSPDLISMDGLKIVVKRFMETFGFGSTQEFMEAMEEGITVAGMQEEQIQRMKVAIAETLQDTGAVGPEADSKMVESTKVGVVEAMKDTGMLNKQESVEAPENPQIKILESIKYADAPDDIRRQLEAKAGLIPSQKESVSPVSAQTTKTMADAKSALTPKVPFKKK